MNEIRPVKHDVLVRRAVIAGLTGTLALAILGRCNDDTDDLRLSSDAVAATCQEAGITIRPGKGSAITVHDPASPKIHFSGFPENIVTKSIKASGKNIVITDAAVVPAAANQSLERTAREYGFAPEAIECLNGVDAAYVPSDPTTLKIPRAVFDESSGTPVVVEAGDTLFEIAREYCSSDDQRQAVDDIQNRTGLDPKALQPGDIVYLSCTLQGEATITEPNAEIIDFVDTYAKYAQATEDTYGVPKEVALAIAIVESGYGKSELAVNANNFHGLKANDEWNGPTYRKITTEHVTKDQIGDFEVIGEPKDLGNGYYEIKTPAYFKKFESVEAGFRGFGDYVKNRFDGQAYKDAFRHEDPREFLQAMVDNTGARYATDINYIGIVDEKISGIMALELPTPAESIGTKIDEQESGYVRPTWESLSAIAKGQFENNENYFKRSMEQAHAASPTAEGYKNFVGNIEDLSDFVANSKYNDPRLFPPSVDFTENPPRITLHHTAWLPNSWGNDAKTFLSAALNNGLRHGDWGAANAYLTRDGKKLSLFTKPDKVAWHVGQTYSRKSRGIETPALRQSDVTTEQYEGLIYYIVWQHHKEHPGAENVSYDEMRKYVIGHGEVTELGNAGATHGDFPTAVADAVAQKASQFYQELSASR